MPVSSPEPALSIDTVDYHTGGEPFRIVTAGFGEIAGSTVAERRVFAQQSQEVDRIRKLLVQEPRGHTDMYGGFVVPPDDAGAHFGVLFWHKDGYSTACGHGTIALGVWAVETGLVAADPDGVTDVVIDVPSGRVAARVVCEQGRIVSVAFRNVASYVIARGLKAETPEGIYAADLVYGGAIYACLDAAALGLAVLPENYGRLREIGRAVKWALNDVPEAQHADPRLSGVYGTIIVEDLGDTEAGPHQRNMTVFADGEVDRSPCGSGTSARVALLAADGRLEGGRVLTHDSVVGTRFIGRVAGQRAEAGRPACIPEVEGMAFRTGRHTFELDPRDPVGTGFILL